MRRTTTQTSAAAAESADTPLTKGARITGDSRGELRTSLKELYEAGASIRSLAVRTGRSYGFVHQVLAESGAHLRSRGGPNRRGAGTGTAPVTDVTDD